ncbi:MAG: energy transducer TonB [Actinomycetota bacterium]
MKKLLAPILITFLSSIFALSQTDTPKSANWQTFAPLDEEFSIETPIALSPQSISSDNLTSRFSNYFDGTYFFIFSDNPKTPFQYNRALDFVKGFRQIGTIEKIGEFETEKFAFADTEDFYHTVLTVKTKNRVYVFQTTSATKDNSFVERFFASLKLTDKTSAENTISPPTEVNTTISKPTQTTENKQIEANKVGLGNGSGSGGGFGNGRGNGIKTSPEMKPSISPTPNKQTAPLRILSKPRANYTDFARFYQISGKVVLRLTFSANGIIGAVSVVSKLPFGLTEQAIIAARGISFEPAMKEGVALSVTKMIEYNFTIY